MENLLYKSTRGGGEYVTASQAILQGIAEDGGLFVPEQIPALNVKLEELLDKDYRELAYTVISKFLTDFSEEELKYCINNAYDSKFDTPQIAPLRKAGEEFYLELYHGPTLAFKDMALSILPYLLKTSARKQNISKEIVILTATSGDTGKAALEGFSDVEGIKIIVFFPEDGVSEVQKRQMTTHKGANTYVVGIKGNFDDAQSGVKRMFNDAGFLKLMENNNYMFSSANSINIGRLIPQVVYYFYAYLQMCNKKEISVGDKINVVVPTGNFGNILAAYIAKEMGLPLNKMICASNDNKVLYDFMNDGVYDRRREFVTTISPSMDILISSNLERLLYLLGNRESSVVRELMSGLSKEGFYSIPDQMKAGLVDFYGAYATEEETRTAIRVLYKETEYLIDTHTAVAYASYRKYKKATGDSLKSVIVSTASPYKFTKAVMGAVDESYAKLDDFSLVREMSKMTGLSIPDGIADIENREILHKTVCEKNDMEAVVKAILKIK